MYRVPVTCGYPTERGYFVSKYLVENEEWGDVDDPDAWNIGYAHFDCTADQLAKIDEETG